MKANNLFVKRSKCAIVVDTVEFLGYSVTKHGVYMQRRLMDAIQGWPQPQTVKDVQSFLGLTNFCRRFIHKYADIVRPISDIVREKQFEWTVEQRDALVELMEALTTAPVLAHPKSDIPFELLTDASKYAVGATLQQNGHPVAYLSQRLSEAEKLGYRRQRAVFIYASTS